MSDVAALYRNYFYAWAQDQAGKLRSWPEHLRPDGVDIAHLAEEIEELARSEERALNSLLFQRFLLLPRLDLHPDQRSRQHWAKEVNTFRMQIPSWKPAPAARQPEALGGTPATGARRVEEAFEAFLEELRIEVHDDETLCPARFHSGGEVPIYRLGEEVLKPGWYPEHRSIGTLARWTSRLRPSIDPAAGRTQVPT